jgi:tungstate transport system ATP-binding protein
VAGRALSVILGPNGAGKTLLMRICAAWSSPTAARCCGAVERRRRALALRVGLVFQKPMLLRRSALANIVYALRLAGVPWRERKAQGLAALDRAGLAALAHAPARLLSGGEQQRLQVARAMSVAPDVCSSTSRRRAPTRPRPRPSKTWSAGPQPAAPRSCSSPTIWARRGAWPTR